MIKFNFNILISYLKFIVIKINYRYLVSGDMSSVPVFVGLNNYKIIKDTCEAIWIHLHSSLMLPPMGKNNCGYQLQQILKNHRILIIVSGQLMAKML